jgi:hypothetical protein
MRTSPKEKLSSLWKTARVLREKTCSDSLEPVDKVVAHTLAWLLPESSVCAVYSKPMDALEMYVLRVGNWVVGDAGSYSWGEYAVQVNRQNLVPAPCRLRPLGRTFNPDRNLTECLAGLPCLQELDVVF